VVGVRFAYDAEANEVENQLAQVEALRAIAQQLERIADDMQGSA
jgi:hypothetical protein